VRKTCETPNKRQFQSATGVTGEESSHRSNHRDIVKLYAGRPKEEVSGMREGETRDPIRGYSQRIFARSLSWFVLRDHRKR